MQAGDFFTNKSPRAVVVLWLVWMNTPSLSIWHPLNTRLLQFLLGLLRHTINRSWWHNTSNRTAKNRSYPTVPAFLQRFFNVNRSRQVLTAVALLIGVSILLAASPNEADWKLVEDAMNKGLPKTAIEKLTPIIEKATQDKNYDEAIKAIAMKISLEGDVQGGKAEEKIARMRKAIAKAPTEMQPVMDAILANWFWNYFQQNQWRFMNRTQMNAPPGEDITSWDLTQILSEIDAQFTKALAQPDKLKAIPITDYDELLEKGNAPDTYRPTLFDFLAHNAIDFYSSGAQAGNRQQDAFDLSAESPIFGSAEDFIRWQPATNDDSSPTLNGIKLYQQLMEFHETDSDQSAFLDNDLARLTFGNNKAFGEEKDSRYKAALVRFSDEHTDSVISSRALNDLATAIYNQGSGDAVKAHEVASTGQNRFPDSVGGRRCHNLIQRIEAKEARVATERVWNNPRPTIDVSYRNITKVHFRLVPYSFDDYIKSARWSPEQLDGNSRKSLLSAKPVLAWSADLPETGDYKERIEKIRAPEDVASGSYYLIASGNKEFSETDNQISFCEVWESKLALVTRVSSSKGYIDGFVLEAESGKPIDEATIKAWRRDRNTYVPLPNVTTDADGLFKMTVPDRQQIILLAEHKGHSLAAASPVSSYTNRRNKKNERTMMFTDRSIYRPGQTIQYKGVCMSMDTDTNDYHSIGNRDVTLLFTDRNGKLIERKTHRTNDYGSFNGSVTAPRDRLMGNMTLRVENGPSGAASVSVEEYKRPKFQVKIDAPEIAPKLNAKVEIKGNASAYTGAAINDAKVTWRVVRNVRYPVWWFSRCWWMPPQQGGSQEIAHGTSTTSANGTFKITFKATPDRQVPRESEPTFSYTVYADVTDTAGETRSGSTSVNVGYTALTASITAPKWLPTSEPISLTVKTTTLDGAPQTAKGNLEIYQVLQPKQVTRPALSGRYYYGPRNEPEPDPSNPDSWSLGEKLETLAFTTAANGTIEIKTKLAAGMYRVKVKTQDRFGTPVTAELPLQVLDPKAKKLGLKIPNLFTAPTQTIEPGGEYQALWGTGYDSGRAYVEVIHNGKLLQKYWTKPKRTQRIIKQPVDASMRGGFYVRTTMVRENRSYVTTQFVDVPWTNKQLLVKWEHMVSKLKPGEQEKWTAIITGADAEQRVAELVATMYDASLDAYRPHSWPSAINGFRRDALYSRTYFQNQQKNLQNLVRSWQLSYRDASLTYRHWPSRITQSLTMRPVGRRMLRSTRGGEIAMDMETSAPAAAMNAAAPLSEAAEGMAMGDFDKSKNRDASLKQLNDASGEKLVDLDTVSIRKNLNETAFFYPDLVSDEDGVVRIEFTMPEALTEWRFMGFAHDQELRSGFLTGTTVTAKDLMVQPNPPRFLREGDEVEFTVKVSNQSPTRQSGTIQLTFADARTDAEVDSKIGNSMQKQQFEMAAGESKTYSWRLKIPDDLGFMTYKAVASTGKLDDGEVGYLPVLSRRILVTESLPLPIRGPATENFSFEKLLQSGESKSLKHQSLTVQMTSNPSWYAVMALPYLMEYPHECSEQTFNRFYANALAQHVINSDPKIHRIFDQWRATPALDSPLEKNEDLKSLMIEETPWFRQAQSESQARRNVGILFDDNRLTRETGNTLRKITEMQLQDGSWPWFAGGRSNSYITLYITTGFGRMRHLGIDVDVSAAVRSLKHLDNWATKRYNDIKPEHREKNHLNSTIALYLYGRSFFLKDQAIAQQHKVAFNYWISQAKNHWLKLGYRQSQAHLAIALKRVDEMATAKAIMASVKENSVTDDELGMFWRDTELSWWWYRAPIETQAMMIEAFDEVMNDQKAVEDCKVWMLKQKQTQDWKTTKATADAVYSLLLRGSDLLDSTEIVQVTLAGKPIKPKDIEAGTGFYEARVVGSDVKPDLGNVVVKKIDKGVAWGSIHWQYMEDMSKITAYDGTPLKLTKQLFTKKNTPSGPTLEPVTGPVAVGDELVVRIVLKTDRDMEYIHLKDYRGSGTEPVNVLSRYKFQDGLAYYESTRDTASHFFIDYLPKGTYVFEYSTRVQLRGKYQTGVAEIQCMYAPEFNSHSMSLPITVE